MANIGRAWQRKAASGKWIVSAFYGIGSGHRIRPIQHLHAVKAEGVRELSEATSTLKAVSSGASRLERHMTTLVEELSQKARTLSACDRARLAEDLLASLEDGSEPAEEVEAAWEQEIRQRVEEVKSGRAKLIPAEDVYAETRRIYQK